MKSYILFGILLTGISANSQTPDSVILGPGYSNESYYSFENGEVSNVSNSNWDLAFDLSGYGASIRMNRKINVLYLYPGSAADWNTIDTAGHLSWNQYIDGYDSWSQGALNAPANSSDPSDLGWGSYNTITHITEGSRIFVIKLDDDSYRKLFIETLASGIYTFKYANIDGSNLVTETITKADYTGQNFIHYSILNEQIVDREPASDDWDIVFTNYVLELAPGYFSGVTSVLSNSTFRALTVSESNNVPVVESDLNANPYDSQIDLIGYDWKSFNMGTFTYEIEDSLCYFIKDENNNVWKLVFTGFAGSSTGKIYFTKEKVAFASVNENQPVEISVYPVPANDFVNVGCNGTDLVIVQLFSVTGQLVWSESSLNKDIAQIPLSEIPNGFYIVQMISSDNQTFTQKIQVQH